MLEDTFLDFRSPKSPKRFFFPFSPSAKSHPTPPLPPLPPLPNFDSSFTPHTIVPNASPRKSHTPSSSTSSNTPNWALGNGAQVVRTPSEALRGVKHHHSTARVERGEPRTFESGKSSEELRQSRPDRTSALRSQKSETNLASRVANGCASPNYISEYGSSYSQPTIDIRRRQSTHFTKRIKEGPPINTPSLHSSFSSTSSPFVPEKSPDSTIALKKISYRSIAPSHRYQPPSVVTLEPISTFDPFGIVPLPLSPPSIPPPPTPTSAPVIDKDLDKKYRRSTIKPLPRPAPSAPSVHTIPFEARLISKTVKPSPTIETVVLVILEFGYSTDTPPNNKNVTVPLAKILHAGGELVNWLRDLMPDDEIEQDDRSPEMTDGSSAEESELEEYDLNNLLRDEYSKSLFIASPTVMDFDVPAVPTRPLKPAPRASQKTPRVEDLVTKPKRAARRNQYTQLVPHPSPLSAFSSPIPGLSQRRRGTGLKIEAEEMNGGGRIITYTALLCRDSAMYHAIFGRLCTGTWARMDGGKRRRVEEECRWLSMEGLVGELEVLRQRSGVKKGGEGYI